MCGVGVCVRGVCLCVVGLCNAYVRLLIKGKIVLIFQCFTFFSRYLVLFVVENLIFLLLTSAGQCVYTSITCNLCANKVCTPTDPCNPVECRVSGKAPVPPPNLPYHQSSVCLLRPLSCSPVPVFCSLCMLHIVFFCRWPMRSFTSSLQRQQHLHKRFLCC